MVTFVLSSLIWIDWYQILTIRSLHEELMRLLPSPDRQQYRLDQLFVPFERLQVCISLSVNAVCGVLLLYAVRIDIVTA